jgi:ribosome biogenesis GTPase A
MSIQWYPGHMTKARTVLAETMPQQDVIIEVLDARMPSASENPVVTELRRHKPCIKVLSKSDLADPEITSDWIRHFEAYVPPSLGRGEPPPGRVVAVALRSDQASDTKRRIFDLCQRLVPNRGGAGKPVRSMVCGIPNVGKSTLINTLTDRKVAKTGDEPAVTKTQQKVSLSNGMLLSDNPGIMWPKIEDPKGALRLAFGGAIPDSALDYESVATFGAAYLLERYPAALKARFKLDPLPATPAELLAEIGRRRGCLRKGGVVDMQKASDLFIHDFRSGALGRISLEAPPAPRQEAPPSERITHDE